MLVSIAHESAVNSLRLDRTVYYWYRVDCFYRVDSAFGVLRECAI